MALAVGGFGLSAFQPSVAAAANPVKGCQTVDVYSVYSSGSGDLVEVWTLTVRQRVVGCWTYDSSPTITTSSQQAVVSAFNSWFNSANPDAGLGHGTASASFVGRSIGTNPSAVGAFFNVNAGVTTCNFLKCMPANLATYSASQNIVLYSNPIPDPVLHVGPTNNGWAVQSECHFQSGSDTVSYGCSLTGQWMDNLGTTYTYPNTPTPTPAPTQTSPRPGTCSLKATMQATLYVPAGSGYSIWPGTAPQGTQVWASRGSQLYSQTYFLPILTGPYMGKLIRMSDISLWNANSPVWNGTCY